MSKDELQARLDELAGGGRFATKIIALREQENGYYIESDTIEGFRVFGAVFPETHWKISQPSYLGSGIYAVTKRTSIERDEWIAALRQNIADILAMIEKLEQANRESEIT